MSDPTLAAAITAAILAAVGLWLVICGLLPRQIRLSDALGVLISGTDSDTAEQGPVVVADPTSRLELAGAWLYQSARLPLSASAMRALMLQGRSIGDYFVNKLVLALGGLVLPQLLVLAVRPLVGPLGAIPVGVGLICGVVGWFWPDLALRNQQQQTNADAEEALNTLFDLVVLERLANMSATQAMAAAARISEVPVFVQIRDALERARLEQRPPWSDLHRLSRELELPPIGDMADVMRLDDQGAALAGVLAARVKELRDAHLTRERARAHQASERMTLWMSIPVIIFALAFLIPPLLTMSGVV
ncbi:MAG: hypothetical protein QM286_04620 [Acidobacteriota bacterium]|nr:hypothetical protein [Acidobacteriota bacterium]